MTIPSADVKLIIPPRSFCDLFPSSCSRCKNMLHHENRCAEPKRCRWSLVGHREVPLSVDASPERRYIFPSRRSKFRPGIGLGLAIRETDLRSWSPGLFFRLDVLFCDTIHTRSKGFVVFWYRIGQTPDGGFHYLAEPTSDGHDRLRIHASAGGTNADAELGPDRLGTVGIVGFVEVIP